MKQEAALFNQHDVDKSDLTRDELGLWGDFKQAKASHHKATGIAVIAIVLAILILPLAISYFSDRNNDTTNDELTDQGICLNNAFINYKSRWKKADTDGDGKLSYNDGATDITTSYYDAAINCYRIYKTEDSDSSIADYQQKRQQAVDSYNTWVQTANNRSSTSCISNAMGYSVYTRCY